MMNIYQQIAVDSTLRQLTRLDRRPWSPTFGCFDREYWKYKTLIEFPRATLQQSLLALALLYSRPFEGNPLAGNPLVFNWLIAGIEHWLEKRNRDGSVNEWYANEHSFCATAFTTAAISETLVVLGKEVRPDIRHTFLKALELTVQWLTTHDNPLVANQQLASLFALKNLAEMTDSSSTRAAYEARKNTFLNSQTSEGWFPEYGGCDIGYSFLTLDLLAMLNSRTQDLMIESATRKLLHFVSHFVHPDGTTGGEYGSRSTLHCFPLGLELLALRGELTAKQMLKRIRSGIASRHTPTPSTVDDTYAAYFYVNSFCGAACLDKIESEAREPGVVGPVFFEKAGLFVHETEDFYLVIGASRGGVWRLFNKRSGEVYGDVGYVGVTEHLKHYSSQCESQQTLHHVDSKLDIRTKFRLIDTSLPLSRHVIAFKMFSNWVLRIPRFALIFNRLLKRNKIFEIFRWRVEPSPHVHLFFCTLTVRDEIVQASPGKWKALYCEGEGSPVHSPSSQIFNSLSLMESFSEEDSVQLGRELSSKGSVSRSRSFDLTAFGKLSSINK